MLPILRLALRRMAAVAACSFLLAGGPFAAPAEAQANPDEGLTLQPFVDFGYRTFAADESFEAVLDSSGGLVYGAGVRVGLPNALFFEGAVSRFSGDGERVFVFGDEVFRLGIPVEVGVTPVTATVGYRFARGGFLAPYIGGGFGAYRYSESADFVDEEQNVEEWHAGYHLLGGVELPLAGRISAAGEVRWITVPDALGEGGVSAFFDEDNLGGLTLSAKVLFGF